MREAMEEAGILIRPADLAAGAQIEVCRPVIDGLLREIVHVFDLALAPGTVFRNLDGEVEAFAVLSREEVLDLIESGGFTVEAALASIDSLLRHCDG